MDALANLAISANPPFNVVGSTLFLSYIVVALIFTTSIILSQYSQYRSISSPPSKSKKDKQLNAVQTARKRHIKIYAFLASTSFASLSYHMLGFLIKSYSGWAESKELDVRNVSTASLKTWMWDTAIFERFAKELVQDGGSAVWTQATVLTMWFWNVWMAGKAQRYGFTTKTMVPFIMLSQILPISFAISLFIIQLHLSALSPSQDSSKPDPKLENKTKTTPTPSKPFYKKTSLALPTILINASLICLPPLRDNSVFIPLVLFTRLLLLLPYSGRVSLHDKQVVQGISISGGFVVAHLAMLRKVVGWRDVMRCLKVGGEAVKALGWDAQIGALVYVVLGWGGGV